MCIRDSAYAALGVAAQFNIQGAREAQQYIAKDVPTMMAGFGNDPAFAIAPKN